jgi:hypothetical protein
MKTDSLGNGVSRKTMNNPTHYLNLIREDRKYRINIKDIKKLYRIEKKRVSPPPFQTFKEMYVPTAESDAEEP